MTPPDALAFSASDGVGPHSVWAYDLDSLVLADGYITGFSRILQVTPRCLDIGAGDFTLHHNVTRCRTERAAADRERHLCDGGKTTVYEPPAWGPALLDSKSWPVGAGDSCGTSPVARAWKASHRVSFWQQHECRIWQFSAPRGDPVHASTRDHGGDLTQIHSALCSAYPGCYPEACIVFSASLCKSGADLLALDSVASGGGPVTAERIAGVTESWCEGHVLESELKRVLPWYESVRRQAKRHRSESG